MESKLRYNLVYSKLPNFILDNIRGFKSSQEYLSVCDEGTDDLPGVVCAAFAKYLGGLFLRKDLNVFDFEDFKRGFKVIEDMANCGDSDVVEVLKYEILEFFYNQPFESEIKRYFKDKSGKLYEKLFG